MAEPLKVMIVDDDRVICELLREFFGVSGDYKVFTAEDGYKALELLNKIELDCIFVDYMMPGMTGLQLLEKVKGHNNSIPVVIMTGCPSYDATVEAMDKGACDVLTKPFKLEQIRMVLERLFAEPGLRPMEKGIGGAPCKKSG